MSSSEESLKLKLIVDGENEIPAAMAGSAESVENATQRIVNSLDQIPGKHREVTASVTEARHALMGMGEEIGVRMPRFVSTYISHLEGVAPVLGAAFGTVAVIGMLQVLEQIPEAFEKIEGAITGWDKKAQEAYKNQIKENEEYLKILEDSYAVQLKIKRLDEEDVTKGVLERKKEELVQYQHAAVGARNEQKLLSDSIALFGVNISKVLPDLTGTKARIADLGEAAEKAQKKADDLAKEILQMSNVKLPEEHFKEQEKELTVHGQAVKASGDFEKKERDEVADHYKKTTEQQLKETLSLMELFNDKQIKMSEEEMALQDTIAKGEMEVDSKEGEIALRNFEKRTKEELHFAMASSQVLINENLKVFKAQEKEEEKHLKHVEQVFQRIDQTAGQSFLGWIQGTESFAKAMERSWTSIASIVVRNLLIMAEQMIATHLLHIELGKKDIAVDAKKAAASVFSAVMKALPFPLDVVIAPIAAGAAFAGAMAFASFDHGGVLNEDMAMFGHKKEMMLPPDLSVGLQNMIRSGSPSGSMAMAGGPAIHYAPTIYGGSRSELSSILRNHADDILHIVKRGYRNGHNL